jgi:hypothetical protein
MNSADSPASRMESLCSFVALWFKGGPESTTEKRRYTEIHEEPPRNAFAPCWERWRLAGEFKNHKV